MTDIRGRGPSVVLPKDKARQGVTGHNVRYVLYIGLGATVVALALIYALYFGS